jgi:hypothetical protein
VLHTQAKYSKYKSELESAKEERKLIRMRKKNFDSGKPFSMHRFATKEEMIKRVDFVERKVKSYTDKVTNAQARIKYLKKLPNPGIASVIEDCKVDLKVKMLKRIDAAVLLRGRQYAYDLKLRRPWDGRNGRSFQKWKHEQDKIAMDKAAALEEQAAPVDDEDGHMDDDAEQERQIEQRRRAKMFANMDDEAMDMASRYKFSWSEDETSDVDGESDDEFATDETKAQK